MAKEKVGTFDFDPEVVLGWKEKCLMREDELSRFAPLAKLFAVLKKKDEGGFEVEIEGIGKRRLDEIGKIISQTENPDNFRGGIGITEISTRYAAVESGALEARVGVIISNFEQLSVTRNKNVIKMFYPGQEFLIVYGWQTVTKEGTENTASIFTKQGSITKIDLANFDRGMRRYLYCTLHHFEWEFGDQGRIHGILHFWTPDTVRLSIKRVDNNSGEINNFLLNDISPLLTIFEEDVERNKDDDNRNVLNKIKQIRSRFPQKLSDIDENIPSVFVQQKSVGVATVKLPTRIISVQSIEYALDVETEKIYLGWVIEAVKYAINNTVQDEPKKIYIKYKQLRTARTTPINFVYIKDNVAKQISVKVAFDNVFFVPVNLQRAVEFIRTFRGSFKHFLDSLLQKVNEEYEDILSLALRTDHGVYTIDDLREKSIDKDKRLQKNRNGKIVYEADEKTPVLTYGFSNSLAYNVKITSTIPPDIIWAQGIAAGVSERDASKIVEKSITEVEKNNNMQWNSIYEEYIKVKEEAKKTPSSNGPEGLLGRLPQVYVPGQSVKKDKELVDTAIKKDRVLAALLLSDKMTSGSVELGTILRNYFNGLTITIHGTTGFQAFKSFLFKGFELLTTHKGIDGLYSIIMVNDVINPKTYQTVIEARRVNTLTVL